MGHVCTIPSCPIRTSPAESAESAVSVITGCESPWNYSKRGICCLAFERRSTVIQYSVRNVEAKRCLSWQENVHADRIVRVTPWYQGWSTQSAYISQRYVSGTLKSKGESAMPRWCAAERLMYLSQWKNLHSPKRTQQHIFFDLSTWENTPL